MGVFGLVPLTALMCLAQQTTSTKPAKQKVVFVCEHGSVRSVIAAAHFNRRAAERGLPYEAVARGVQPDEKIPAAVVDGLTADGLSAGTSKPAAITPEDVRGAAQVVTFACTLPDSARPSANKLLQWDNPVPSITQGYEAARKVIVDRVDALIADLAAKSKAQEK